MTSSRSDSVLFEVFAPDEATEVFLIDSTLTRIASGVGRLEERVAPGFYKVRFRSGASQHDELVEVASAPPRQSLTGRPVPFASAAPIANSLSANDAQAEIASRLSRQGRGGADQGSLFLFLRQGDMDRPFDADGVTIHSLDGERRAALADGSVEQGAKCAGLALPLDHGTYRLRVSKRGLGDYDLFVSVCGNWQTQVFLTFETFEKAGRKVSAASLRRGSVFMVREGEGFSPGNPSFRLTDLAKQALAQGRSRVSKGFMDQILYGKFEDPMMGLFAAHLLLQGRQPGRRDLTSIVLHNLEDLLGGHPDLLALRLADHPAGGALRDVTIEAPPLLAASWRLMALATRRRAGLIEPDSVPGLVAHNVANGGPWLLYRLPGTLPASEAVVSIAGAEDLFRAMLDIDRDRLLQNFREKRSEDEPFSGLEQSLLNLMLSEDRLRELADLGPGDQKAHDYARLLRRIDAPAYSVASAVASLNEKLSEASR